MSSHVVPFLPIPVVTVFVRHSVDCPRKEDEFYKSCKCRKHLRWSHGGRQYRKSAQTRVWAVADERRRQVEAQFKPVDPGSPIDAITVKADYRSTIERAVELFVSNK